MSAMVSPYPGVSRPIVGFEYLTPLWLARGIDAVQTRRGEDADYIVGRPYRVRYRFGGEVDWRTLTVPAGFLSDLASVPRVVRPLIDRVGPHLEASIVHDYLYVAWQDLPGWRARPEDRLFADDLFLAGMAEARVPSWKREVIYRSVRVGGGSTYRLPDKVRYAPVPEGAPL